MSGQRTLSNEAAAGAELPQSAQDNVETIADLVEREHAKVGPLRAFIERISAVFGTPGYFLFVTTFITAWIVVNLVGQAQGWRHYDEPPFFWLQGIVSSNALLLTIAVLIRQDRMAELAERHSHLDLQINMLTERKVTKILELVARKPSTDDACAATGHDEQVAELSRPADAEALLTAIKDQDGRLSAPS